MTRNETPAGSNKDRPDTPSAESLVARVTQLESLHTHMQQTIDDLNEVVVHHERRLEKLERSFDQLAGRVKTLADALPEDETPEPPPPHY